MILKLQWPQCQVHKRDYQVLMEWMSFESKVVKIDGR
jgi:hypothetical protein